jgi:hypothetical protein
MDSVSIRQRSSVYYLYMLKTKLFDYRDLIKSCEFFIQKVSKGSKI